MNRRSTAVLIILSLIVAAFVVPYTLLANVYRWTGSFLFWILFVLAAIGVNIWIAARWRDKT
ncbi:hypothetical protein [Desmospora profundinema]|uniref:Uncharacterized protein n=1 Tax=Desmospora profundinema TaxID=1571184 RepID=A0ABU1IP69_9BACL|nr:hypothetical protein [Desmospora profundinema]MDR6225954.1 hypothetical protein [Desmospora profundinema]